MITYIDTSVVLKLLVADEVGGDAAERLWLGSDYLVSADIGYAEDGHKEQRTMARYDGEDAVAIEIRRQSGANSVDVIEGVQNALKSNPGDGYLVKRLAALREEAAKLTKEAAASSQRLKDFAGQPVVDESGIDSEIERLRMKRPSVRTPDDKGPKGSSEAERLLDSLQKQIEAQAESGARPGLHLHEHIAQVHRAVSGRLREAAHRRQQREEGAVRIRAVSAGAARDVEEREAGPASGSAGKNCWVV